jgi:hypothetical protein
MSGELPSRAPPSGAVQCRFEVSKMSIESLEGLSAGQYVVTTYNGTRHFIDLDNKTAVRVATSFDHVWTEFEGKTLVPDRRAALSGSQPKMAAHLLPITPDGKVMHFDLILNATLGESMRLENADEWRTTSTIRSIEPWVDEDAS